MWIYVDIFGYMWIYVDICGYLFIIVKALSVHHPCGMMVYTIHSKIGDGKTCCFID